MQSQHSLNIVLSIPNAKIYLVNNEEVSTLVKGSMNLVELPAYNTYIISVEDFGYNLSKEIPVMTKKLPNGETLYILPNVQGHFGVKLPADTNPQLISVFETILQNSGEFIVETEQVLLGEAKDIASVPATTEDKPHAKDMVPEDEEESDIVVKSGEVIRSGLIKVATLAAVGISKAGTFMIQRLIKKSEDVEVKESTQERIRVVKSTTSTIAVFTSTQIANILIVAGSVVKSVSKSFDNSNQGQELREKPAYYTALNIGKSAVQAAATVYDGMKEASGVITKELARTTAVAVTYKYGQKLGDATTEVFEIVENVGNVYGSIGAGVVRALASKEKALVAVN